MKTDISSMDLYYLVSELKFLEGSKIDKVMHSNANEKELVIILHTQNIGKNILKITFPSMIYIDSERELGDSPSGLCMQLRKYLEGSRIKSINQVGFQRIISINIDSKYQGQTFNYNLILELFSKGNIIFTDDSMKILGVLESRTFKDKSVTKDSIYTYPKTDILNVPLDEKTFNNIITNSDRESIVKTLAIKLSLGGVYSEEILHNANISKDVKPNSLQLSELEKLYVEYKNLFNKKIEANLTNSEVLPFKLNIYKDYESKDYESFNKAILENHVLIKLLSKNVDLSKNLDKIKNVILSQEKLLGDAEENYVKFHRSGEIIYENYAIIEELLNTIKLLKKTTDWNKIKDTLLKDERFSSIIKDINESKGELILNFE